MTVTLKEMEAAVAEELAVLASGIEELLPYEDFVRKLYDARKEGRKLRIKYGADPSAPDLHLGHTVPIRKLLQFQEFGHQVVFIVGDFTARIGDPTGKSETRKALTKEQVEVNAKTYLEQIFKILDEEKTEIVFNSSWFEGMTFNEVISLCSKYTVARMLERDDFAKRYHENRPIYVHEFLYPLVQGYDSYEIRSDLELGGTDQTFNFLVGRVIQKEMGQEPQCIMTLPILEGLDGVQKMSKSLGNYIGITDSAQDMFGKVLSISDELMPRYYSLLLSYTDADIEKMKQEMKDGTLHPKKMKAELAKKIIEQYYTSEDALAAEAHFEKVHKSKEVPDDIPEFELEWKDGGLKIIEMITQVGFAPSNAEAKRLVKGGGVSLDGKKINDMMYVVPEDSYVLKVGKRKFAKVK